MSESKNNNLSILVIEDNPGDFLLVEDYLIEKFKNISISHCDDFESTKKELHNQEASFDAILLDLNLPDLSGEELIKQLLEIDYNAPVLILTGYTDIELAKKSLQAGIDDFLIKDDINPDILHKSIVFAINRHSYIKQIEIQNEKLKNIAWTQSHVVRAPLARMLGIMNLIEESHDNVEEILQWIKPLRDSANEMDEVVRKIVTEAQQIK